MTQPEKLLQALSSGRALTARQITAQYRIASPTKVVSRLRAFGWNIVLRRNVDTKGRPTNKYSLVA